MFLKVQDKQLSNTFLFKKETNNIDDLRRYVNDKFGYTDFTLYLLEEQVMIEIQDQNEYEALPNDQMVKILVEECNFQNEASSSSEILELGMSFDLIDLQEDEQSQSDFQEEVEETQFSQQSDIVISNQVVQQEVEIQIQEKPNKKDKKKYDTRNCNPKQLFSVLTKAVNKQITHKVNSIKNPITSAFRWNVGKIRNLQSIQIDQNFKSFITKQFKPF